MNIIVCALAMCWNILIFQPGNSLWQDCHSCRTASSTPASPHKGTARARSRAFKAWTEREETSHGYQEERQGRSDGMWSPVLHPTFVDYLSRMHAKSWPKTWFGHEDTFKNSIKWRRNCRLLAWEYRPSAAINKWRRRCVEQQEYVPFESILPTLLDRCSSEGHGCYEPWP